MKKLLILLLTLICTVGMIACGQKNGKVDKNAFSKVEGGYQCIEEGITYLHLSILVDDEKNVPWLSIYDNEAGNPGVEGEIINMNEESITIQIDMELFDEMPPGWKEDGETLTMKYRVEDDIVVLSNNGTDVRFQK